MTYYRVRVYRLCDSTYSSGHVVKGIDSEGITFIRPELNENGLLFDRLSNAVCFIEILHDLFTDDDRPYYAFRVEEIYI